MSVQTPPTTPPADGTAPDRGPASAAAGSSGQAGAPTILDGHLISTNPATGAVVDRFPVANADAITEAVQRARTASAWWQRLGFDGRRERLLRWRATLARRLPDLVEIIHDEGGKPAIDGLIESAVALDHVTWSARNAERVLRARRVRGNRLLPEFSGWLEYEPFGVVGVVGPWNYPIVTPMGSITYALAAGNAVVFKPSEYTPATGRWFVDRFAEVVPEQPVLQVIYGAGETGANLVRSGVDKVAFTGSPATARKIMAACAENLTPVLIESGGKDAMIVDADADLDAAAEACVWGGMTNAGQTCVGIERVYVVEPVYQPFLTKVVERASRLQVGGESGDDIGPITMPAQINVIRRHIEDAISRGGRVMLGGPDAVRPPFVHPTILVDVPEDAAAVQEETFGPTLTVKRVRDADEAVKLANAVSYGLGGAVYGKARALSIARRMRTGMVSINGVLSFAGMPSLPFGGVGDSGFGRIHGDDGLREFARPKAITKRRLPSFVPLSTFDRGKRHYRLIMRIVQTAHGGRRRTAKPR